MASSANSFQNREPDIAILQTLKPDDKTGIPMRADLYEGMKREIVHLLQNEDGVPLQSFFEILHKRFVDVLGEKTGWYLFHMKLDLEARGVLKIERSKGKRNIKTVIKMTTAYQKHKSSLTIL
jgi:hypothetical protein